MVNWQVHGDNGAGIAAGSGTLAAGVEDRLESVGGEDYNWDFQC